MSKQIIVTLIVEFSLIFFTTTLLTQPRFIFEGFPQRVKAMINYVGLIFLCLTFCWSVILGCRVALQQFPLGI